MAVLSALSTLVLQTRAHAGDWDWDDITAPYTQRLDTMTSSAGNAQRVNAVTHVITPWPRHVHNPRIPANGARMVGAMRRYQDGGKERLPLARKEEKSSFEMTIEAPSAPAGGSASSSTSTYNSVSNSGKSSTSATMTTTRTEKTAPPTPSNESEQ